MRYVRAAKPFFVETPLWSDEKPGLPSLTVDDGKIVDTGLIDQRGDTIYRVQDPVGFHRARGRSI